jgi:predicted Zn-dependent peptidase
VIAGAERLCGRWTGPETARKLTPVGARGLVKTVRADRFDRAHVAFFSPAPSAQDPRRFAAEVLAEVAGGGEGSRLYWALEEPGLAETASLSFDPADAAGAWIGYLSGDPEHAPDLTTRYRTVLDQLTREGVSADEVARNARKLAAARVLQGEASFRRMVDVGFDWMYGRRRESIDATADRLLAVTDREVNTLLAERPFDSLTVVATGPLDTLA